jgi:AraC family transcriptional regulator
MKIEEKNIPEMQVAFIFYRGTYEKIPELLGELVGWLMAKGVEIKMPIYGTYYNNPLEVAPEDLEWEVGAVFIGEAEGEGNIMIKTIPEHQVLSTIFKGPYGEAASVYSPIFEYAADNNYQIVGPVTESYLNIPDDVAESELLTEVMFPVVKK